MKILEIPFKIVKIIESFLSNRIIKFYTYKFLYSVQLRNKWGEGMTTAKEYIHRINSYVVYSGVTIGGGVKNAPPKKKNKTFFWLRYWLYVLTF